MTKRTTTFTLMLPPRDEGTPSYRWLYTALRGEILGGRLHPGAQLPATRDLARQYGLSRGTVVSAFEQLKSEGYVEGSTGSGTYVSKVLPDDLFQVQHSAKAKVAQLGKPRRMLSDYARQVQPFPNLDQRRTRAFRSNVTALELFPIALWTQVTARRLRRASTNLLMGCEAMGYLPLREAVAAYLSTSRGVKCSAAQVMILSGTQEALDLTSRVLLNPGDRVCLEDPGYVGAYKVCESLGAKIVPVPLDEEGMTLPAKSLRAARMIYITPGHHFPLGITMSLSRRLELLEWANQSGAMIFEDDYDSEFRYAGRPIPALQGLDRGGQVIFSGSFSKVLFSSLRLGYLVIPDDLVDTFAAAKSVMSRHVSLLDQATLCDFITEGHFGRHLRRMREVYAERFLALIEAVDQKLKGLLEVSPIEAGLQTTGWLGEGLDGESAMTAAAEREVEVFPLSRYCQVPYPREGVQLGFAAIDPKEIRKGAQDLAIALEKLRKKRQ